MSKPSRIFWSKEKLESDYQKYRTHEAIAIVYGCSRSMVSLKMKEFSIPHHYDKSGEQNPKWRGGRRLDSDGYIQVYSPDHPNRTVRNEVPEHRLVMEQQLGRYLLPQEVVHHKDEVKNNNDPDNLELCEGGGEHVYEKHRNFRDKLGRLHQTVEKCDVANKTIDSGERGLTDKQQIVLGLLTEGYDRAEIANKMGIVRKSVHNHISALREKGLIP